MMITGFGVYFCAKSFIGQFFAYIASSLCKNGW